ncbi:phytanoyl-CoA dioxygenase family protein, partial [Chloroflexi bacterium TSY]|nr:phytanoyl-CoA dioxygenase family protein [Chloroflexi bacterium TSY]
EGQAVILPMQPGDVLLMDKRTPHRSTRNVSETVRWSVDLRYQKTGTPTGRPFYPDFVVRSRSNPAAVLTDHAEWDGMWTAALANNSGVKAHRWDHSG